jgi:hypothetical protein
MRLERTFPPLIAAVVALGLSASMSAHAQPAAGDCDIAASEQEVQADPTVAVGVFMDLVDNRCLGLENCTQELCVRTGAWAERWRAANRAGLGQVQAEAFDLIDEIRRRADALPVNQPGVATFQRRIAAFDLDRSGDLIGELRADPQGAEWDVRNYTLFATPDAIDALAILEQACATGSPSNDGCVATFRTQVAMFTFAGLQTRILSNILKQSLDATVGHVLALDQRWQNYFQKSRAILPWELLVNGWLFRPARGFNEPPSSQIILMHPTAAMGLEDAQLSDASAALVLELAGWYGWRWGGADQTEMKAPIRLPGWLDDFPLGGSVILGFDGDRDPGFGGVLHLPRNWSLGGMVDRGGDFTLLVSVDLLKLFIDPQSQRRELVSLFRGD